MSELNNANLIGAAPYLLTVLRDAEDLLAFHIDSERIDPERGKTQPFVEVNYQDWTGLLAKVRDVIAKTEKK